MKKGLISLALAGALLLAQAGAATTAVSRMNVTVNGWKWVLPTVTVVDETGGGTNYVKLRDVAYCLKGTGSEFSVEFDGSTLLTPGESYQAQGDELKSGDTGSLERVKSAVVVGEESYLLDAVWVKTGETDGYLYYKLRDLATVLGFQVGWTAGQGVSITTPTKAASVHSDYDFVNQGVSEADREMRKVLESDWELYGQ